MKRAIAAAITLLFILPAWAEPEPGAPPKAFEFTTSPAHPRAGDQIFYRLAWTNQGEAPVRVPKEMLDDLEHSESYHSFSHYMNRHRRVKAGSIKVGIFAGPGGTRRPPPPPVEWITLAPEASIERHGALSEFFESCRGGCKAGSYVLELRLNGVDGEATEPDQIMDDDFEANLDLEIRPSVIRVTHAPGLELVIRRAGKATKDGLKLKATLTNRWKYPIWFPKPGMQFQDYDMRIVKAGKSEETGGRTGAAGQGNWDEGDAFLVKVGASVSFKVELEHVEPAEADEVYLQAVLRSMSDFEPAGRLKHPHYYDGTLTSKPLRLR